jgi:hypothetical protein
MASVVELLPKDYGYVVLVAVLYSFLNFFMAAQVGKARKRQVGSFSLWFLQLGLVQNN